MCKNLATSKNWRSQNTVWLQVQKWTTISRRTELYTCYCVCVVKPSDKTHDTNDNVTTETHSSFHTAHMNLNTWIDARVIPCAHSPVVRFWSSWSAHHIVAQVWVVRISHVIHACSERYSSTVSSPFHPTSPSSHSLSISCSHSCISSTTLRAVATLRTSPKKEMESFDESYLHTRSDFNKNLLFLSVKENLDSLVFWVATWFPFWRQIWTLVRIRVSPYLCGWKRTELATNFPYESDKSASSSLVPLSPEWTVVKTAFFQLAHRWVPHRTSTTVQCSCRRIHPGRLLQKSLSSRSCRAGCRAGWAHNLWESWKSPRCKLLFLRVRIGFTARRTQHYGSWSSGQRTGRS